MIIECPSCSAKFNLPDGVLANGARKLKCSKCSFLWTAKPPKQEAEKEESLESLIKNTEKKTAAAKIKKEKIKTKWSILELSFAAITAFLFVTSMFLALLAFSPGTLGFSSSSGMMIASIEINQEKPPGGERFEQDESFTIKGTISNIGAKPKLMPIIRVKALTKNSEVIYTKKVESDGRMVTPNSALEFEIQGLKRKNPAITRFLVEIASPLELFLRNTPDEPSI